MEKQAKKGSIGRPAGPPKEAINLFIKRESAKKLRKFAKITKQTNSIVVETALDLMLKPRLIDGKLISDIL